MGQNGQEPIKQTGVGIGLADTEGKLKFTILDFGWICMLHRFVCLYVFVLILMLISKYYLLSKSTCYEFWFFLNLFSS